MLNFIVICKSHTCDSYGNIFLLNVEVTKVLTKIAKVSGCEAIAEWVKNLAETISTGVQKQHVVGMGK